MTTVATPQVLKDKVNPHNRYTLIQYVKDENGHPFLTLLAERHGDDVYVGWSMCNLEADSFDKHEGLQIAKRRILKNRNRKTPLPRIVVQEAHEFIDSRCMKYFKDATNFHLVGRCTCDKHE